jgi:hypothetical protein
MTLFARYYNSQSKLVEITMDDVDNLIKDEKNKKEIADAIFNRYFDRYLKIFYYPAQQTKNYIKTNGGKETQHSKNVFNEEYKSGFSIMTNCCLLIEAFSTFLEGQNQTNKNGKDTFKLFFKKAATYNNSLKIFETEETFYKNIRCGLLHQGETYGKFKIRRDTQLFDSANKTINAKLFCDALKEFLTSYKNELASADWANDIWDKCRIKLRHIIQNSR